MFHMQYVGSGSEYVTGSDCVTGSKVTSGVCQEVTNTSAAFIDTEHCESVWGNMAGEDTHAKVGEVRARSPRVDLPMKRRRRQKGREPRHPRRDNRKSRFDADYIEDDQRTNPAFEAYYRAQGIVPDDEMPALLECLATPLPSSFRITAVGKFRRSITEKLEGEFSELFERVANDRKSDDKGVIKPPSRLPWYPDGLAWTVSAPRQMLRRDNVLSPFHKFLVQMNDLGAINRQEAVSMVPPILLDMRPGLTAIDLCAAPGSKTAQILDTLSSKGPDDSQRDLAENGLVLANDADIKRCWMLTHQLKRFGSADLMVTHHEAQFFPKVMAFDRVLCDVPCTGDGTLRKAPDIWRRWTAEMGIGIHRLQIQILMRGLDLLKPGGRLVYSTCSMNPVENEAVVAHAMRKLGSDIELIDVSSLLPELKRRPGMTSWKVKNNSPLATGNGATDETEENGADAEGAPGADAEKGDAEKSEPVSAEKAAASESDSGFFTLYEQVPHRRQRKIVQSLFPPSPEELASGSFPLERCLRLVPHDQDTGAFFVAVIQKKAPPASDIKVATKAQLDDVAANVDIENPTVEKDDPAVADTAASKAPDAVVGDADTADPGKGKEKKADTVVVQKEDEKKKKGHPSSRLITDDPLIGLDRLNPTALADVASFFGLDVDRCQQCFMTRGSDVDNFKRILVVSPMVRKLLSRSLGSPEAVPDSGKHSKLRVVHAGVRTFERSNRRDSTCPFRIISDGVLLVRSIMTKRVVSITEADLVCLLQNDNIPMASLASDDTKAALGNLESGSAVLQSNETYVPEVVVVWKGKRNILALMPREQLVAMRQRHGVEVVEKKDEEVNEEVKEQTKTGEKNESMTVKEVEMAGLDKTPDAPVEQ